MNTEGSEKKAELQLQLKMKQTNEDITKDAIRTEKHLPFYGIGPALCFPMAVCTTVGIVLSKMKVIPGQLSSKVCITLLFVAGILFICEGVLIYFCADLGGSLQKEIKENRLKTNGSYRIVRNPCYVMFLLCCTGAILIAHNIFLFILPFFFYIEMTVVLIKTEEKWLKKQYGQEYVDYCKHVNRCIPWFPRK